MLLITNAMRSLVFGSYSSFVDGLRRAPNSFAELTYHSQFAYLMTTKDGRKFAARFRLIPVQQHLQHEQGSLETGMLWDKEQEEPWKTERREDESRRPDYLRDEFIERVRRDEPVGYQLQMQTTSNVDDPLTWHPQKVGNYYSVTLNFLLSLENLYLCGHF